MRLSKNIYLNVISRRLLLFLFIVSVLINFSVMHINIPSEKRSRLVLPSSETAMAFSRAMISARKNVYNSYKSQAGKPPVLRTYLNKTAVSKMYTVVVSGLKRTVPEWVINNMRSFLMQSFNPDEQQMISALERIRKNIRRPDPKFFYYGGFYVYSAGAFLYLSSLAGIVTLTSDMSYYFHYPGEMRKIYLILKLWGLLFASLTVFIVFYAGARMFSSSAGLFAACFYVLSPIVITDSGLLKPYGFSLFWIMLAFIYLCSFVKSNETKKFHVAAVFWGLAAGSLYLSLFLAPAFVLALYFAPLEKGKLFLLIKTFLLVLGVFLLVNPYFPFNLDIVYKEFVHVTSCAPFKLSFGRFLIYFFETLPAGLSAGIYILFIAGLVRILRKPRKETLVFVAAFIPAVVYTAFTNYKLSHYSVVYVPFMVLPAGYFADFLWRKTWGKIAVSVVFAVAVLNAAYYLRFGLIEDTRISAGRWINKNIPEGSSIGCAGGFTGMAGYPVFRLWDYRLKPNVKTSSERDFQYYIWIENEKNSIAKKGDFRQNFVPVQRCKNNIDFFEKAFFAKRIVKNYGRKIIIYKRK